jgi:hypothetical protein
MSWVSHGLRRSQGDADHLAPVASVLARAMAELLRRGRLDRVTEGATPLWARAGGTGPLMPSATGWVYSTLVFPRRCGALTVALISLPPHANKEEGALDGDAGGADGPCGTAAAHPLGPT